MESRHKRDSPIRTSSHERNDKHASVAVIIPALNEQQTIGRVLAEVGSFLPIPFATIVVDGHSDDNTVEEAMCRKAEVLFQSGIGYGDALRTGFRHVLLEHDVSIIAMMDADGTYDAEDLPRLLKPIMEGEADIAIGNRLASMDDGAMGLPNKVGNIMISKLVSLLLRRRVFDSQCGVRVFSSSLARDFLKGPKGMSFATVMLARAARRKARIAQLPVHYHPRVGTSKLRLVRDGVFILVSIFRSMVLSGRRTSHLPSGLRPDPKEQ